MVTTARAAAFSIATVVVALSASSIRATTEDVAKQPAGIYVSETPGAESALVRIPGSRPTEVKTKGIGKMMLTQGLLKGSIEVELAGPLADIRIAKPSAVFYVFLDPPSAPSGADPFSALTTMMSGDALPPGARTGADFTLVRLTVTADGRRANVGKLGSQGGKMKDAVDCSEERVAQGIYRLRPKDSLKPGEYAFFFSNSMGAGGAAASAWPFGVDAAK